LGVTRLDSAIRRLTAQRSILDWAASEVRDRPGLILELGLGNGRTYDHLRDRLPGRDIYVFERAPAAHPDCMPPADRLLVGDFLDRIPDFARRFGPGCAVLIHADIGTGDEDENRCFADRLGPLLAPLLCETGLLVGDRGFPLPGCRDVSGEIGVESGRYFAYRKAAGAA
jgi:hypothetical protein